MVFRPTGGETPSQISGVEIDDHSTRDAMRGMVSTVVLLYLFVRFFFCLFIININCINLGFIMTDGIRSCRVLTFPLCGAISRALGPNLLSMYMN